MQDIDYIIQKYEVPKEYFDALCDAYEAGAKRGFIDGSIKQFNTQLPPQPEGTNDPGLQYEMEL